MAAKGIKVSADRGTEGATTGVTDVEVKSSGRAKRKRKHYTGRAPGADETRRLDEARARLVAVRGKIGEFARELMREVYGEQGPEWGTRFRDIEILGDVIGAEVASRFTAGSVEEQAEHVPPKAGLCPCCGELFRLSDSKVFLKTRPKKDWMDILQARDALLDGVEERIDDAEEALREKARIVGRRAAQLAVRRIDPVFAPRRLNADDAKVLFHPVDYVVFRGMKEQGTIREIILLDGETRAADRIRLQKSIEKVIEMGNYEWLTVRVQEDGAIVEE